MLVADPPCTPWSRAGKRLGTADERDMLEETAELITLLRPRFYLIGNVPGLQDATSWHVVQRVIGGLGAHGYCVADYVALDAADYGVPQHRVRPFWFGHPAGSPCVRWPAPTHSAPSLALPGLGLAPWVTCRDALQHLPLEQLGRPVRLKRMDSKHPPCAPDAPGTTVRSGGNGNAAPHVALQVSDRHPMSVMDAPSRGIRATRANTGAQGGAAIALPDEAPVRAANPNLPPANPDEPHRTIVAAGRGHQYMLDAGVGESRAVGQFKNGNHLPSRVDEPALVITTGGHSASGVLDLAPPPRKKGRPSTKGAQSERIGDPDGLSVTVDAQPARIGSGAAKVLGWPWDRPATTIQSDERMAPPGHRPEDWGAIMSQPNAVVLSEAAAAILQGFPEGWLFAGETKRTRWSQIGQAMPPALAEAVARAIRAAMEAAK